MKIATNILMMLLLTGIGLVKAQSNWFWLQPLPQGNRMTSMKFVDAMTGCGVGDVGTILKTTNGGQTWRVVIPPKKFDFTGVDYAKGNPNVLVATGDSGRIVRSSDGGETWYITQTVSGVRFTDVDFSTSTDAYAVGLAGRIYKSTDEGRTWAQQFSPTGLSLRSVNFYDANYGIIGGDRRIMLTSNGGVNWFVQNLTLNTFDQVVGVSQLDSVTALGVTNYSPSPGGKFYKTTNGGAVWDTVRLNIPALNNALDIVRHMSFGTKNNGVICCDLGSILRTTNGGNSWNRDSSFIEYYQRDKGIGLFWSTCWSDTNTSYITGGGGNLLKSTNIGQNWSFNIGGYYDLHGLYFTDRNTGWAVGEEGTIQKTTNGGSNWTFYPPMTRQVLREVMFPSYDTGYICGDTGTVLKTTNAGESWFSLDPEITALLFDVYFINNQTGFIGGGFTSWDSIGIGWIRETNDGGENWNTIFYDADSGAINEIQFFDENTGVALSDISIKRTTNSGQTWTVVAGGKDGEGNAMHFPTPETGYVLGPVFSAFKTTNGGVNWTFYNTGAFEVVLSVHFSTPMKGYAVSYEGAILYTSNGGVNWSNTKSVTFSFLRDVYLVDTLTGFISGEFGNLLKTTNGGISSVSGIATLNPGFVRLDQNYPNPFNPSTTISFSLNVRSHIRLEVFDVSGRRIRALFSGYKSSGKHEIKFDGAELSSGIYLYTLNANNQHYMTKKMILIK